METTDLLLMAAAEGPNLRAAASAASSGVFSSLELPRSVILIAGESRARLAAEAVIALTTDARAPITIARGLPHFVGALDLVIVLVDDPGDPAADVVAEATRRGAQTVVVDPGDGPVRAAASSSAILVPRPAMSVRGSFCGYLGATMSALTAAGVTDLAPAAVLDEVADAVDADSIACAPERDLTVNPARQIASWIRNRAVVLAGEGDVWRAIAELGAAWMLDSGTPSHGTAFPDLMRAVPQLLAVRNSHTHDIFFDPLLDDSDSASQVLPLGAIVVASPANVAGLRSRLEDADWARVICPAEEVETRHPLVDVCVTAVRVAAIAAYVPMEEE
ncbi:hypothetical protein [Corynebacterium sp. H113]|uniref:hypothetical protein n=1 Tax=Corynebacterium sp. H113 TaxID=3133419 RepID=UPI0030B2D37D